MNVISFQIKYFDLDKDCRNTADKCGLGGSEYVEKSKN